MTVTVRTTRTSGGSPIKRTHTTASSVAVKEGHLFAQTWDGSSYNVVAVYAPGQWMDATTEEPEQK